MITRHQEMFGWLKIKIILSDKIFRHSFLKMRNFKHKYQQIAVYKERLTVIQKKIVTESLASRDVNVLTFSIFSLRYDKFSLSVKR